MKLLMHICCAPCSTYPFNFLKEQSFNVTGFFYNPNIHPKDEYQRRLKTVKEYADTVNLKVDYIDNYMEKDWLNYKGSNRCEMCYSIRLEKTASYAKEYGFDTFTTSLLVSPYQNHDLIKELGEKYAHKYGIRFYYHDFRPFFRQGQAIAREMNLYRQRYCGCIISFNNNKTTNTK